MFICEPCLDKYEGSAIETARFLLEERKGSYGPCEVCGKTSDCVDIPSYGRFKLKGGEFQ